MDRWTETFEQRVRDRWTDAELLALTAGKELPILPTTAPRLLRVLGLLDRDAALPPSQLRKFFQLNHMIRLLGPPLRELMERGVALRCVDAGCGLSYLTLALAWWFENVHDHPARILGVDQRSDLIESCRDSAGDAGLQHRLEFQAASIRSFDPGSLDVVFALHACDTATDDAIALGWRAQASLIAVAPCCQAELARAWAEGAGRDDSPLVPLQRTPHLRREAAATVTDTLRMQLLELAGYEVRVVEFVPTEHTAKNTLIRAMRRPSCDVPSVQQLDRYLAFRDTIAAGFRLGLEGVLPDPVRRALANRAGRTGRPNRGEPSS